MNIIINIVILIVIIIFLIVTRHLYLRNQRLKNKAQLNMIFTSITHELLTPLTIMSASVENLREKEPGYKREYDLMDLNIQRSVRLLQQILEASKASDGRLKLLVANGDVMSYIRETARCVEGAPNLYRHTVCSQHRYIPSDVKDRSCHNIAECVYSLRSIYLPHALSS